LTVLDVGANVGDSALQILDAVDARILCVEGDDFYLDFLDLNVGEDPRVTIVAALLSSEEPQESAPMRAVRAGGTSRFVPGAMGSAASGGSS
jgi:FkbM family methyltransferase